MSASDQIRTTVCPGGPLLVRGAGSWPDRDGVEHPVTRPVVAICRCQHSQRLPWCDGTHKLVPPGWDAATNTDCEVGYRPQMSPKKKLPYTIPGLDETSAKRLIDILQQGLHTLNDLQLTLKHVHWNVVGPHFIAVHEMIDPQVDQVRAMADETAERIATLGGAPVGTPGALVKARSWDDYDIGRAGTQAHLAALDGVYEGVISSFRKGITETEDLDPVTQDMLIGQTNQLELFHWFVRAHLEDQGGGLDHSAN